MAKKIKIGVIFGGQSGEHEVSLVSAASVILAMSPKKYEVIEIGITLDGRWLTGKNCLEAFRKHNFKDLKEITLPTNPKKIPFDIVFPVLHGPYGEDGTIQGLFDILHIPYVGCGVLASSTSMDKLQTKALWQAAGLKVVPYIGFNRKAWKEESAKIIKEIKKKIGFPLFVKPANMGSSVGISKVKVLANLKKAIDLACEFDRRILVEKGLNVREIECAILGNDDPISSPVGEVIVGGEFYDFYDKYVNGVSKTEIPAKLDKKIAQEIQGVSVKAYKLLDCSGLARVDSFIDLDSGDIYLNEINTMPGFTSISMYPKMMAACGIEYSDLIDKLIFLGFERFQEKQKNKVTFESGTEWYQ
ncbi:MAG: D-alanine--D-alanine ligase family protein [Candidatus Peregrinibacteria bacterium]|nr:D-alanine--D-alanine ligase family protein [Candidatus Peregrinibacteria bacterium]